MTLLIRLKIRSVVAAMGQKLWISRKLSNMIPYRVKAFNDIKTLRYVYNNMVDKCVRICHCSYLGIGVE